MSRRLSFLAFGLLAGLALETARGAELEHRADGTLVPEVGAGVRAVAVTGSSETTRAVATPESSPAVARETAVSIDPTVRYVLGSAVNLREKSADSSRITADLRIGIRVSVLETRNDVVRVRSDSGEVGWMPLELLTDSLPTVESCVAQARAASRPSIALVWQLRAYGLAPWDRGVIVGLEAAYRAAGETEKADEVAGRLNMRGPLLLGSCVEGACDVWLELDESGFHLAPETASAGKKTVAKRLKDIPGWLFVQDGTTEGWLTPPTSAWQKTPRNTLVDPGLGEGLMISRLTRPLQPAYGTPSASVLRSRISAWLMDGATRPAWIQLSRTGPTPVVVRALPLTSDAEDQTVVMEVAFDLQPLDRVTRPGRYFSVLVARMAPGGRLEVLGTEGLLEPEDPQSPRLRSARLRGLADLDGDGRAEVLLSAGSGPDGQGDATELMWRARIEADAILWKRDVVYNRPKPVPAPPTKTGHETR